MFFGERGEMFFRRGPKEYSFELIKPDEVDQSVDEIAKTGVGGILSNRDFLKKAMGNQESTITIVAKKDGELKGVVNGMAVVNPQVNFIWVKDVESSMEGVPRILIDRFEEEAKKRVPKALSIDVNLPTFDVNSIALYSVSGFVIEEFVKGTHGVPDVVIMRRRFDKKPRGTPIA